MPALHINQLPPEILACMFDFSDYQLSNCNRLLQLACVCKHWHDIFFAYPRFWTVLACTISTKLKNEPHPIVPNLITNLERWFGRAGDMPWSLDLSFDVAGRKTALLYKYLVGIPRWKSLVFSLNITGASNWTWLEGLIAAAENSSKTNNDRPCWPDLETLEIEAPGVRYNEGRFELALQHVAPNLRHLKITIADLDTSVFTVFQNFPWANLVHFEFTGKMRAESLAFYFHLLSQAPNLETLKALDYQHDFCPATPLFSIQIPLPLTHVKLRHLALHDSPNVMTLLKCLRLPSLSSLDLSRSFYPAQVGQPAAASTPVADAVRALVLASRCEIKTLRLKWTPLLEEDLCCVLTSLPTVEHVDLDETACFWALPSAFFARLEASGNLESLMPKLRSFAYNRGYRCYHVQEGEEGFVKFKSAPLTWWTDNMHKSDFEGGGEEEEEEDEGEEDEEGSPSHYTLQ